MRFWLVPSCHFTFVAIAGSYAHRERNKPRYPDQSPRLRDGTGRLFGMTCGKGDCSGRSCVVSQSYRFRCTGMRPPAGNQTGNDLHSLARFGFGRDSLWTERRFTWGTPIEDEMTWSTRPTFQTTLDDVLTGVNQEVMPRHGPIASAPII